MATKRGGSSITGAGTSTAAGAISDTSKRNVGASNFILLLVPVLFFIPLSEAAFWRSPRKTVIVHNWEKIQISIRCFSFDDEREVHHLKPQEGFNFTFRQSIIFPSSTMWNCSTNEGAFTAFTDDYDCNKNQNNTCKWRFNLQEAYRYSPKYKKWIPYEYNPNYQSLARGGVVKGQFVN